MWIAATRPQPRGSASSAVVVLVVVHALQHRWRDNDALQACGRGLLEAAPAADLTLRVCDTGWVRDLETVYFRMWDIHCSGQLPNTFEVS